MRREWVPSAIPQAELIIENSPEVMADGGTCIAGPDGEWLVEPLAEKEELIVATLDHRHVREERQNLDLAGHYARPDVTKLIVNRERQNVLAFDESPTKE